MLSLLTLPIVLLTKLVSLQSRFNDFHTHKINKNVRVLMMRNTRCMGVLRLIMLPFRFDELRGEPPLELVAVEALHVVGLLEQAQRWVGRVQPAGGSTTNA